jgi:hypothetical protein
MIFLETNIERHFIEREFSIFTLAEIAGIGGGQALEAILSPTSQTGKALRSLGIENYALAGSITRAPGNYLCDSRFDSFSKAIQSMLNNQVKNSSYKHWKEKQIMEGFQSPHPLHQLFDFMTGRNIDVLIEVEESLTITDIYNTITDNLALDLDQKSSIHVSHITHAGRLEMIRIRDLKDLNNQGINIIIKTKGDTWNSRTTARINEVVPVQYREDGTPYIKTHIGVWHEPNEILFTPGSVAEWHAIFIQELRRTAMQPDRGMNLSSFIKKLDQISSDKIGYSHEQVCLITANLARAFDRFPVEIDKILKGIPILQNNYALKSNTHANIESVLSKYAQEIFGKDIIIDPHLIHLLSISLPIDIRDFMNMEPTAHTVHKSTHFQ